MHMHAAAGEALRKAADAEDAPGFRKGWRAGDHTCRLISGLVAARWLTVRRAAL